MPDMKTLTVGENTYTVVDGSAVHFTEQTLTAEQRAQARKNIGIYSGTEIPSDWQEGDIFIDTDGGSQTVNLMENASVAVGAPGLITENVPNLSYYTEAAYSRATLNPLYFYAESGTLNVSLSDYSVYQFTVYCYSCDESAKDADFSFTEGTIKYFEMNSSKVYESGWKTADFSLEINGTCLIALMFRRQDDANLDSADTAQIKTLLTATVTRTDDGSAESPEDTYELPIATADTLGGVKPVQKTEDMTQSVGVDESGGLWTAPGGTVSGDYIPVPATAAVGQTIKVSAVDADGKVTAVEAVDMPGGESEADALVVVFTTANLVTGTASHSASEISSAAEAGKLIWGRFAGDDISGTPIAYLGSIGGKARFGITTTNVDSNGVVGATLIYVDDTKTLTITRGTYIMAPEPTESDIGKTLAVDAAYSVAWQTPSGGVKPVQKTEDMTQSVGVDESGGLWTAPSGGGGEVWETINEAVVEDVVMTELDCNFDDYKKVAIMLDGFGTKTAGKVNAHFGYADSNTTKQICQMINTVTSKRYGYILIDTVLGQIVYTENCNWAQGGASLKTVADSLSVHNYIGATKVKIIAIDSAGGGSAPSATNTMMGKIKLLGVRK